MKIKKMAGLMALVFSMGAFSMPLTAHAGGDTTPPTVERHLVFVRDYAVTAK